MQKKCKQNVSPTNNVLHMYNVHESIVYDYPKQVAVCIKILTQLIKL